MKNNDELLKFETQIVKAKGKLEKNCQEQRATKEKLDSLKLKSKQIKGEIKELENNYMRNLLARNDMSFEDFKGLLENKD